MNRHPHAPAAYRSAPPEWSRTAFRLDTRSLAAATNLINFILVIFIV